jgi:autotransporter strand-loop-strand O-heptosyltransferase
MIGIGSGVSWLSWALEKPVIMISGFSTPSCEFSNKNYRVINQSVCNGCFNDVRHKFDRGDWNWCPRLKGTERMFECTTRITPDMVKSKIHELITGESL